MRMYWRYFLYVLEHKINVLIECWKVGLFVQGITHDWSKFSRHEFLPYARKFYSGQKSKHIDLEWEKAWLHHQKCNKHHWEHWVVNKHTKEALPMPKKYIVEMVCDWRSFSRMWGRKAKETHLVEKMMASSHIILHPDTREELEKLVK